ncbi:site-specific integrase [Streptomyces cinerochromogenes]|uniref:site-specific integrase n=1 Tax=Streptomyces cinerochromogenes TaxID=66422 RepID=UPI0016717E6F|nr:tyrosine-type recombinase/integrase [Streptomyces cinerochromogenes]GGS82965.1 integrase [Streptomyces cinerochromogenes]
MSSAITKVILKSGAIRYRFIVDGPRKPDGSRRQIRRTFDTKKEALNELARIRHQTATGSFVVPSKLTVDELLDIWLATATRGVEQATASNYDNVIRPVRLFLGDKGVQQLTEEDVEAFVDWMLTRGRQRGGKPGTGLSVRSVRLTLGRLRSALTLAVRRGWVTRNVAEYVRIPRDAVRRETKAKVDRRPWNESEVKAFIEATKHDRLFGVMLLTLIAERPAEVCGARWTEDVDLTGTGTIAVGNTRTIVYDRQRPRGTRNTVVEKDPKTHNGRRVLPLPSPVRGALVEFRALQEKERLAAGDAYEHSGYVVVDELGRPFKTDKLRRVAHRLMEEASVRRVRLYDARHACLSWMANNGVPDTVVSAWAGHSDLSFTKRVYVHPDPQSLKVGSDKLSELLG